MKIGFAQINPIVGDLSGNFEKIAAAYDRLAAAGAELIITPELTLRAARDLPRPSGIAWDRISPDVVDANPVLRDLQNALRRCELRRRTATTVGFWRT